MKAIKKIMVAVLLSLSMVVSFMPINVFAENTVDTWDGTADTSWYDGHETDSEYHITTAEQLAGLAQLVNDKTVPTVFEGKMIYLDNDLNLSGNQWVSIGTNSNSFAGTFEGQYHKVINLYHHYTGKDSVKSGLFGVINKGKVKNLLVIDADIISNDGTFNAGILADCVDDGSIENCYTSGKIKNSAGHKLLGGVIGQCTGETQVKGCGSEAKVISSNSETDYSNPNFWTNDTVGGLIGQWELSTDSSLISDCWFDGSISCDYDDSNVSGILGGNFDFYGEPGVVINNCMVTTKDIICAEPGNVTWITAAITVLTANCIWPDTPPDNVILDEKTYPDNKGNYFAVVKLKTDGYNAIPDPDFNQEICGKKVTDFTSTDILKDLQNNAYTGVHWVAGVTHPTFLWNELNALADYTEVNKAKAKVPSDLSIYTDETVKILKDALVLANVRKNVTEQAKVDGYADAINKAIIELKYKDADYTKVNEAKAKVPSDLSIYTDETVKALKDTLALVEEGKNITEQAKVDSYADAINKAISELKYKDADYTKVNEAKAKVPSDLSIYTDETVKALKDALALVEEGKNITEQAMVDGYANAINKAIEGLVKKNKDYKVIEGEGGTFVKESGKDISIRIDHDFTENVKVEVDDREVDKAHYKVTKGSTIITFDDMYLNTLAVGTHQVKVTFEDGVATTTLVIKEQTKDDKSETPGKDNNEKKDSTSNNQETVKPTVKAENKEDVKKVKTGDDENIIGVALLLIGSLVVLTYLRKKKID